MGGGVPARRTSATDEPLGSRGLAKLVFRSHAIRRMFERRMTVEDVRSVIENGEAIEQDPDDLAHPSRLTLGRVGPRAPHVVVADNRDRDEMIVVTVRHHAQTS